MRGGDKPRLLLDSVLLGIIGGLSAQLFMWMLRLSQTFLPDLDRRLPSTRASRRGWRPARNDRSSWIVARAGCHHIGRD